MKKLDLKCLELGLGIRRFEMPKPIFWLIYSPRGADALASTRHSPSYFDRHGSLSVRPFRRMNHNGNIYTEKIHLITTNYILFI
jgi:hypothetical protein